MSRTALLTPNGRRVTGSWASKKISEEKARKARKPSAPKPGVEKTPKMKAPKLETSHVAKIPSASSKAMQAGGEKHRISPSLVKENAEVPFLNTSPCLSGVQVVEMGIDVEPRASPVERKDNLNRTACTLQASKKSVRNDVKQAQA
ncbi:unnamed protein product [Dicrocoelium dendriticum]|nr:unnamed protein product [Dicrocoelium dendriticum]